MGEPPATPRDIGAPIDRPRPDRHYAGGRTRDRAPYEMKRLPLILPLLVILAVLGSWAFEQWRVSGRELPTFRPARRPQFETLASPLGNQRLRGRVVDAGGQAVEDIALCGQSGERPVWAFSDAEGAFRLDGLDDSPIELVALGWGFRPSVHHAAPGPEAVTITLPERQTPLPDLPEPSSAPLAGVVLPTVPGGWLDGEGYEVVLLPARPASTLQGAIPRRTRTNSSGAFRFDALAEGEYVAVVLPAWARGGTWPDLAAAASRELVHAAPEEGTARVELTLATGAIEGRVLGTGGPPVEGALVLLADGDRPGRLWPPQTSGPEGRFRIRDLPPGPYRVTVRAGEGALEDLPLVVRPGEVRVMDLPELDVRGGPATPGE